MVWPPWKRALPPNVHVGTSKDDALASVAAADRALLHLERQRQEASHVAQALKKIREQGHASRIRVVVVDRRA